MPRLRHRALSTSLALVASTALTTLGVSSASAGDGVGGTLSSGTINVHVTKTHEIKMTQRMHPGMHKFVVTSGGQASFQLAQAKPGYTKAEAMRDVELGLSKGRIPALKRFERNITLVGGVSSKPKAPGVMWVNLPAGQYWAIDVSAQRTLARNVLTISVGGAAVTGSVRPTATIRNINEIDYVAARAIGHRGRLAYVNDSEDNHFLELIKLAPGKTMADFRAWMKQAQEGVEAPPPVDMSSGVATGVVSPGKKMIMQYDLAPGRYVMICWWPDADMHAMPHAFMGMYRGITLN